jgi:uncharacterized membrane protein HdeD (DUF308 family)
MKNQWLIYLGVFVLIIALPFAPVELTASVIFLELIIGIIQIIGSLTRYIYQLSKYRMHNKKILVYWLTVTVYFLFVIYSYLFYINHIPSFLFDMKRQVTFFVCLLAVPIAVWYVFNVSFLKNKKDEGCKINL